MAFTSWCDLYAAMLDAISDGIPSAMVGEVSRGDKRIVYASTDDFFKKLSFVEERCNAESGTYTRRTYAKNGGRGI